MEKTPLKRPSPVVSKPHGDFTLFAEATSMSGMYRFTFVDAERNGASGLHGVLMSEADAQNVGTFIIRPVRQKPLNLNHRPDEYMPCVRICDSEVMTEIQKPENEGAFFLLPSQLNGAEYPSEDDIVGDVEDYKYDNTGGPRGQLAVHPAAAQFILDNAACETRPDGLNAVEGLLEAPLPGLRLQNGYLGLPTVETDADGKKLGGIVERNLQTMRTFVMDSVPACGLTPDKRAFSTARHRVGLIYGSAVPVQAYLNYARNDASKKLHERIAHALLVYQYYGALRAARFTDRQYGPRPAGQPRRIFLMPLGGGVFNNSWENIVRAISLAVGLLTESERAGLSIELLTWSGNPTESATARQLLHKYNKLYGMESPKKEARLVKRISEHLGCRKGEAGRPAAE